MFISPLLPHSQESTSHEIKNRLLFRRRAYTVVPLLFILFSRKRPQQRSADILERNFLSYEKCLPQISLRCNGRSLSQPYPSKNRIARCAAPKPCSAIGRSSPHSQASARGISLKNSLQSLLSSSLRFLIVYMRKPITKHIPLSRVRKIFPVQFFTRSPAPFAKPHLRCSPLLCSSFLLISRRSL